MLLSVSNLKKSYPGADGRVTVLDGVSLALSAGETIALTGESGSGKSTLLHLVAGLDHADEGRILVEGRDVALLDDRGRAALRRDVIGIVFQQFNLVPSLDVAANIALHARLAGRHDPALDAELAVRLGLSTQLAKYPEDLSGGQQQRVAIARTLAARPSLILADEPTGNLDETTAAKVLEVMIELAAVQGSALMVVTHSDRVAACMQRRVRLSGGRLE